MLKKVFLFLIACSWLPLVAQDRVFPTTGFGAEALLVLPQGVRPVEGVLVHSGNIPLRLHPRWVETARTHNMAYFIVRIDMRRVNRERVLREAVIPLLEQAGRRLEHEELSTVPIVAIGQSDDGIIGNAFLPLGDRLVTVAKDNPPEIQALRLPEGGQVPVLYTVGGTESSNHDPRPLLASFQQMRGENEGVVLAVEWPKGRVYGNASTLHIAWIHAMAAGMPDADQAWFGERRSWETENPRVYSRQDFPGDPSEGIWLPTRAFAYIWRAYHSRSPQAQLLVRSRQGEERIEFHRNQAAHEIIVDANTNLNLHLSRQPAVDIRRVRFYHQDQLLTERTSPPWEHTVSFPAGAHPVFAEVTLVDDTVFVTNPALIICRLQGQQLEAVE